MGGADRCAVYGCDNDRRYPDRFKTMSNALHGIKLHKCKKAKHYKTWTKLLNRANFKVTANTRVCSNHFKYGQPYDDDPHPTLYLKGYLHDLKPQRRELKRTIELPTMAKSCKKLKEEKFVDLGVQVDTEELLQHFLSTLGEHDYSSPCNCSKVTCSICCGKKIDEITHQLYEKQKELDALVTSLNQAKADVKKLEEKAKEILRFSIKDISHSDELIKLYTGIPSYELFQWLADQVRDHAQNLHYFRGKHSMETNKYYQVHNTNKPGKKRTLSIDDELFCTLVKLRLNLREEDIAFRFGISQSSVSQIISTWIPFLAKELEAFIYWPSQEEIKKYYPKCFHKYSGCVRCIIDCTEIPIERPSLAMSNNQVYSQYKSRPTLKCLVGITPGGTISFVSKPVGGSTSDKKIVKMTGIVEKFNEGDICMADRGFNIQELFLHKQVKLVIPPFLRITNSTSQFTEVEDTATKTVANARIHVERAIGRLKEFAIMQGPIQLTMIDLMEAALLVCSALVNLQPYLVPLSS